jgi:hypothetical protein
MIEVHNDKGVIYAFARLIDEQEKQIRTLQSMVGAVLWMATRGDENKMREFAAMKWKIENARPDVETERDEQWRAWLLATQREVEQGRAEIPS